ncbi:hypothetical protein PQX77_022037 [Marasmius sp. AFHP31]|nr:hypothetical protein PQX77_022037 [Marasmius sp. AFHP31]
MDLFSQLRAPYIKDPLRLVAHHSKDGASVISVTSVYPPIPDAPPISVSTPTMVFVPPGSLPTTNDELARSELLSRHLSDAWKCDPTVKVICSDLATLYVFWQDPAVANTVVVERVSVDLDSLLVAIRVVVASYTYAALPRGMHSAYLAFPQTIAMFDAPDVSGCLPDPSIPMPTDEQVIATHKRYSDFDLYTLKSIPSRALQFLRWKSHALDNVSQIKTVRSGDVLSATTNGFSRLNATIQPYWPVDFDSIPASTMQFLQDIRRKPPLDEHVCHLLSDSTRFRVKVLEELASEHSMVYRCELVSVDDESSGLPGHGVSSLCIKLIDDRLSLLNIPSEPEELDVHPDASLWLYWRSAEDFARQEHAIYDQLSFAQGAVTPWYYGVHKFTLPNGHWVYGVLMEYIPKGETITDAVPTMDATEHPTLIQSARHAVRVLQHADVSQHDWHEKQVLVLHTPTGLPYTVLFDFAWATTSVEPERHAGDDYTEMLRLLDKPLRSAGMTTKSLLYHYGGREVWDCRVSSSLKGDHDGETLPLHAEDPYAWVCSG